MNLSAEQRARFTILDLDMTREAVIRDLDMSRSRVLACVIRQAEVEALDAAAAAAAGATLRAFDMGVPREEAAALVAEAVRSIKAAFGQSTASKD